ncbi:hypothetical protein [Salinarchaeum laminariae]|uniref:hypothetical protein n=1 Tax=Salinarchaeum laminariae TaxID=869888 RepID=UPI0020BD87B0|nr:hypothetical protein [Salinarchaeum laminariae]
MHPYSSDTERRILIALMGFLALGIAGAADRALREFLEARVIPVLPELLGNAVETNSVFITAMISFSLIYTIYDNLLWRLLSDYLFMEEIPNIQGEWLLVPAEEDAFEYLQLQKDAQSNDIPKMIIGQNWSTIEFGFFDPGSSYWKSDSAMVRTGDAPDPEVICTFQYEPFGDNSEDDSPDRGTLRLRYIDDGIDRLVGNSYTENGDRKRGLEFVRVKKGHLPWTFELEE